MAGEEISSALIVTRVLPVDSKGAIEIASPGIIRGLNFLSGSQGLMRLVCLLFENA